MAIKGQSFVSTQDFAPRDLEAVLGRARELKRGAVPGDPLKGKAVALAFFNPSFRTRLSMELAVRKLGGTPLTINVGSDSWAIEHRDGAVMNENKTEHVREAVRVLGRYAQAICVRAFAGMQKAEEDLSDSVMSSFCKHSPVPIVNMESALYHPCQAMADMMTLMERRTHLRGLKVTLTWAPHPKPLPTAVANSFLLAATQFGCDVTLAHPEQFPLPEQVLEMARRNASVAGRPFRILNNQAEALAGAEVVYAKSWGAVGFYGAWDKEAELRRSLGGWIVDERKFHATADAIFMHCLPVRRNVEVADDVLDGRRNAAYDEAENRLWAQMAILEGLLR